VIFQDKLEKAINKNNSLLCVGLDPDPQKLEQGQSQFDFNKAIVDQTAGLVCCFKPQIAFYSAAGLKGLEDLKKTINYIHKNYQDIPVLLDAKRGDIESTNEKYAQEVFDFLAVDAVTVSPYLGLNALEPLLERKNKGVFVLCRTSNPGASQFQDLKVNGEPLYLKVAKEAVKLYKKYDNLCLVVGSTWPQEIRKLREIAREMIFLVPGIGAQGGDLPKTLEYGLTKTKKGLIISASRGIIYAQDPQKAAQRLKDEINKYR